MYDDLTDQDAFERGTSWPWCGEESDTILMRNTVETGARCSLCVANCVCFVVLHLGMAEEDAGRESESSPPLERSKSAFYKKEGTSAEELLASH